MNADSYTIELLEEVAEFLEPFMDVVDGSYGEPHPNIAMQLHTRVEQEIEALKRCRATDYSGGNDGR